ncbi:MAG: hypothetical protein KAG61_06275, partial [Bacteriovoracaceae bacterium]|nr:hypothetical protein [Bacteriovoracaceae bacterium]
NSAYIAYQKERYDKVLDIMSAIKFQGKRERALRAYMMGLSFSRVEEFRSALRSFKIALSLGAVQKDINYEMGQALYAINELNMAKNKFIDSYNVGFKKIPSLYYLGHISQLLDQSVQAKKYFLKVASSEKADNNLRQVSTFQLAEVIFAKFSDSNYLIKKVVRRYVLPLLNEAIVIDQKSPLADEIRKRKAEILRTYKLNTIILSNGREISKKRLMLNIGLSEKYDNNITYAADDIAASTTIKESSLISEGRVNATYNLVPNRSWVITPSINGTYVKHHKNRPLVYTNDYYQWSLGMGNSFEHTLFEKAASFLLDIDYSYKAKDYQASKSLEFYEEVYELSFGERFRFFKSGDTVA